MLAHLKKGQLPNSKILMAIMLRLVFANRAPLYVQIINKFLTTAIPASVKQMALLDFCKTWVT